MIPRFAEYEINWPSTPPLGRFGGTSLVGYAIERNWEVDADPRGGIENSNFMAERENP